MGSQLDIAGSFILAAMMLMSFNMFIVDKQQAELTATNKVIRQETMSSTTSLLMFDLRKAGYRCTSAAITTCTPTHLAFTGDVDNNGFIDSVRYEFKTGTTAGGSTKKLLYRSYNGITSSSDLDIQNFQFSYLDKDGNATTTPADVKTIRTNISFRQRVANTIDTVDVRTVDFRITPKNL